MKRALLWFRNDLRLRDHPALCAALDAGDEILPVYVLDERLLQRDRWGFRRLGPFRLRFLLESLADLQAQLRERGGELLVEVGRPEDVLPELAKRYECDALFAHREYTHEEIETEKALTERLPRVEWRHALTLIHPGDTPFAYGEVPDVFTQFRKKVERYCEVRPPLPAPERVPTLAFEAKPLPAAADFYDALPPTDPRTVLEFQGGARAGEARLEHYFWKTKSLSTYKETRNGLLGADYSSKFSPWLANGCLSPRAVYAAVERYESEVEANKSTYWLKFELLWRDYFKYVAMKYGRRIFWKGGIQDKAVEWRDDHGRFERWRTGSTGDRFVDANMRELLRTGFMSNRGRQNVASYLVHQLKQDWRRGAAWFESALIDYDPASNYGNWMYAAGVGNDPRDRIFNTQKQAKMYDAGGAYRDRWLEEPAGPEDIVRQPKICDF